MPEPSLNIAPASISDYRLLAQKRLPRQFFDYIDGAAYQEKTAQENINAFENLLLRQRILRDVSNIDTKCRILNDRMEMPVILAPVGLAGCFARRGEVQTVKAANAAGVPFCLSTVGICSIEELKQHSSAPFWFQLYVIRDRAYSLKLLQRARDAGCDTLVFTVDLVIVSERYRDIRNGLSGNQSFTGSLKRGWDFMRHPRWVWDVPVKGKPLMFGNLLDAVPDANSLADFKKWVDQQFDPTMTWQDLHWIRDNWSGKLVIKGILDANDAKQAIALGADAIVVSNHGGRQLDSAAATLSVLPEIVSAVDKHCQIIIDGGIRSGLDVLKALALGADACMIGRAWAYALAADGERGVRHALAIIKNELRVGMALTGVTKTEQISSDILRV